MIYVTSDLHGYPPEKLQALLNRAGFSDNDFLFVLGDVIDRGAHGVELLRWLTQQSNVQLILGNHEWFLLCCQFLFQPVSEDSVEAMMHAENSSMLKSWISNGATPTLADLRQLSHTDRDVLEGILDYLQDAPLYEDLRLDDKRYILVHGGLGNFSPDKPLSSYSDMELLWERPNLTDRYFEDATVIIGHTPTEFFGEQYRGRALKTDTWICIDTGAAGGNAPMLLRLDDLQEFYAE